MKILAHEMIVQAARHVVEVRDGANGSGAGFLFEKSNQVLTNNHVARRDRLQVVLANRVEYPATVVQRYPEIDIAVLSIPENGIEPLPVGDSRKMRTGQMVFAIGHPWGHRGVVTAGIVSSIDRSASPPQDFPIIRSDVVLMPGNSGGPLLDASGLVIGINTMVVGGDQGYSVPIHLVQDRLPVFQAG